MFFGNLNYLILLVASVAGIAVGFIWYAQWAFGKMWIHEKTVSNPGWKGSMIKPMLPSYTAISISTIVTALVLSALFNSLIVTTIGGIIFTSFLVWIGFVVPIKLSDYLFGGETFKLFLINVGYALAEIVVMSIIIGLFS